MLTLAVVLVAVGLWGLAAVCLVLVSNGVKP